MRHRVHGRKLGRTSAHRKAMTRNQLVALFTHERIITTVAKAKNLRPQAEKMVTLARTGTLANRRRVLTMVPDKVVVKRLFDEIAPRFMERDGGYTRILRLGQRRGDAAELAIIEFVDYQLKHKGEDSGGDQKASLMDRAKGLFGGGKKDDAAAVEAPETADTAETEGAAAEEETPADTAEVAEVADAEEAADAEETTVEAEPSEAAPQTENDDEPVAEEATEEKKED